MSEVGMDALRASLRERYVIERELGAGGMATVYLAEDLKHERRVAIKVLRPELAAVLGAERFVQEIKTTAALSHPHILPLFDSGEAGGQLYYVMPYIEGETIRGKLNRETQLGIEEAVKITTEVADALDYAHRHGVIHRDIKPENILLHDGRPMVMDFGIALAVSAAAGGRMTETGLSLGTPHYMSPEQATADKEITGRSDIYSLGSVLYEMLAGEPPHIGHSAQQIIMKIIAEPAEPVTKYRKSVPPNVAAALAKSLEKLPADRFGSAKAFAEALANPAFTTVDSTAATAGTAGRGGLSRRTWWATVAFAAVAMVAAAVGWLRPAPKVALSRQRVSLWQNPLAPLLGAGGTYSATQAAIAPDGSSIVYSDSSRGAFHLMRKLRSEAAPMPIAGTDGALSPFFSPDGRWVGYRTADGKLKKVPIDGGGSVTLADNGDLQYTAAAWLDNGTIIYSIQGAWLGQIADAGGVARPITPSEMSAGRSIVTIAPLPDSRGFLFTDCPGNPAIESTVRVFDLRTMSERTLVRQAVGAWYSPTGHLLYTDRAGGLYAMGFDLDKLTPTTGPTPVIADVVPGDFATSRTGTILYTTSPEGSEHSELTWVSRSGSAVPIDSTWHSDFQYPALSPDGTMLAVSVTDATTQLWIRHADGTRQKLTDAGTVNWRPAWTPDGKSVIFSTNRQGGQSQDDFDLYQVPVNGSAEPHLVMHHTWGIWEAEYSHDGRWLIVRSDENGNDDSNIRARRLDGDTALVPILVDPSLTTEIALSPDGRWIAYTGDATGRDEIYVSPFPQATSRQLVSRNGGAEPRWAHSGRELFYKSGDQMMVAAFAPGAGLVAADPRPLFRLNSYRVASNRQEYDVTPDDQRFVMIRELSGVHGDLTYAENWFPELVAKVKP